jgi:xanthine dehydrogenase accessory factor
MKFYRRLAEALQVEPVVVATVIEAKGSVPRETGAKMFICADGRTCDTIGGGAGEAKIIRRARAILKIKSEQIDENHSAKQLVENSTTQQSIESHSAKQIFEHNSTKQLVEINLSGSIEASNVVPRETEGICGGRMKIWLERWAGESSRALVGEILKHLESGRDCVLATPLTENNSPYLRDTDATAPMIINDNDAQIFIERLQPPPVLLIVGAGHVGVELAKAAAQIEFQIILQDDRPEQRKHASSSDEIMFSTEPVAEILARFASHPQLYAALVSRAYQYDLEALKVILRRESPCKYIGVIGSERRVRQVLSAIDKSDINEASWASIHAPIGLRIGALTPAEIAVSIAAELISVRRGKTVRRKVSESKRLGV